MIFVFAIFVIFWVLFLFYLFGANAVTVTWAGITVVIVAWFLFLIWFAILVIHALQTYVRTH
jgi:hypothetical protein